MVALCPSPTAGLWWGVKSCTSQTLMAVSLEHLTILSFKHYDSSKQDIYLVSLLLLLLFTILSFKHYDSSKQDIWSPCCCCSLFCHSNIIILVNSISGVLAAAAVVVLLLLAATAAVVVVVVVVVAVVNPYFLVLYSHNNQLPNA